MMLYGVPGVHGNAEIHMCTTFAYMHCFKNEEVVIIFLTMVIVETLFKIFTKFYINACCSSKH